MQSDQEALLEDFVQRSFGAQALYLPIKFRKGGGHREPADLAWVANGVVALFYLTRSGKPLQEQITHNRNQAKGYFRLWSTGRPTYALRGKNRFGDECFVPHKVDCPLVHVLVVSHECGISLQEPISTSGKNVVVVIPELLLVMLSEFGGTFVDLLNIALVFVSSTHETNSTPNDAFRSLQMCVHAYVQDAVGRADPEKVYLSGNFSQDYVFLIQHLSSLKLPASFSPAVSEKSGRETISRVFCDMSLIEYASLAAAAERAIQASEPPSFKKWVVLRLSGLHYTFVVGTLNLNSNNVQEAATAALDACRNEKGEVDAIEILYANILNANDYRSPMLIGLPPSLPAPQAAKAVLSLASKTRAL